MMFTYRERRTVGFQWAWRPRDAYPPWLSVSVCLTWPIIWLWKPGASLNVGDSQCSATVIIGLAILTVGTRAPQRLADHQLRFPADMGRGNMKYFPFKP